MLVEEVNFTLNDIKMLHTDFKHKIFIKWYWFTDESIECDILLEVIHADGMFIDFGCSLCRTDTQ